MAYHPAVLTFLNEDAIEEGIHLLDQGKPAEALEKLAQAKKDVASDPMLCSEVLQHEIRARQMLAHKCMSEGAMEEAEAHARAALDASPGYPDMRNLLSEILIERGKYQEAISHLDRALKASPTFLKAWVNKARALARLGRISQTRSILVHARKVSGGRFLESHYDLALSALREGDFEGAAEEIANSFDLSSRNSAKHLALGMRLIGEDRPEDAYEEFLKALEKTPNLNEIIVLKNVRVHIVGDIKSFHAEAASYGDGVLGYATPGNEITVLGKRVGNKIIINQAVLGHELEHLLNYNNPQIADPDHLEYMGQ